MRPHATLRDGFELQSDPFRTMLERLRWNYSAVQPDHVGTRRGKGDEKLVLPPPHAAAIGGLPQQERGCP